MDITVTGSISRSIARLRSMANPSSPDSNESKLKEIAERLCKIGEGVIRQVHGNHAEKIETVELGGGKGYKIVAEGEDLLFIEFGAGDAAGSENALYDAVPDEAHPGTWSRNHPPHMYARYGFWVFAGRFYREVQPTPAFYYAYEAMVQNLPLIAREVFGR